MSNKNLAIDPDSLYKIPGFHQVMVSQGRKTIHIAGQAPYDEHMELIGAEDYKLQAIKALQNIATALAAAGAQPSDVVSSVLYVKALDTSGAAKAIMEAMATALDGQPFPAHAFSIIGVAALEDPRVLVEITAVAALD